jgi:peptidoglycan LD-endopeptidase LytH
MDRPWGWLLVSVGVFLGAASDDFPRPPVAPSPIAAAAPPPPAPAPSPKPPQPARSTELLAERQLKIPVQGIARSQLRDTFHEKRGVGRTHKAIDIMAPWGTPVLAADDGKVAKISSNRGGGLSVYQVDPSGRFVYYYAHLAGYADDLREGQAVRRGDVIGYVGTTGNAPESAPHLHFAVLLLAQEKRWWGGEPVNPYDALARDEALTARLAR